jgi:hypothetical protein
MGIDSRGRRRWGGLGFCPREDLAMASQNSQIAWLQIDSCCTPRHPAERRASGADLVSQ